MLMQNPRSIEQRLIDVERDRFGVSEFDWVFVVLGDPFNTVNERARTDQKK